MNGGSFMNRERIDRLCELGIVGLVLLTLICGVLLFGAAEERDFHVMLVLTLATWGVWLVRIWVKPNLHFLWPPSCWAALVFLLWAVLRYFQADVEYVARAELFRIVMYGSLFFLVVNNIYHRDTTQWVVFVLIFLGTLVAMYGIYQYVTDHRMVWGHFRPEQYGRRASGTYINPNHFAGFLELVLPLAFAFFFAGRLRQLVRISLGYAIVVLLAGIALSLSRGGWFATAGGLAVFFGIIVCFRRFRMPALLSVVMILSGVAFFYLQSQYTQIRLQNALEEMRSEERTETSDLRDDIWAATLEMWQDHPWMGVGPAHFDVRFDNYRPEAVQARAGYAHNDYLNTLAEWGILGSVIIVVFMGLLGWGIVASVGGIRRSQGDLSDGQSDRLAVVFGVACSLVALLIHSVVDFNMHVPANAATVIVLMGLLTAHWRYGEGHHWLEAGTVSRCVATVCGLVIIGVSLVYLSHRAPEQAIWNELDFTNGTFEEGVAKLEQMASREPANPETSYLLGRYFQSACEVRAGDYEDYCEKALQAYQRARGLNPHQAHYWQATGILLDALGQTEEAGPFFEAALERDPNGYEILGLTSLHHIALGQYEEAKSYLLRSLYLKPGDNQPAQLYLPLVEERLALQKAAEQR